MQKNRYFGQVLGLFFSFFTFNLLVFNFALLKLKSFVRSNLRGCSADRYSPRGLTVSGCITKRRKERKKERKKSQVVRSFDCAQGYQFFQCGME